MRGHHCLVKPLRMLILGSPGAGKGTQTALLLHRFSPDLKALSSGDLLRANIANRTPLGIEAESSVSKGQYVRDEIMTSLIVNELNSRGWMSSSRKGQNPDPHHGRTNSWILDGFPRTINQAAKLDEHLEEKDAINFVVSLEVPHKVILERISGRLVHPNSGRIYNTTYHSMAPKVTGCDDMTGEALMRRPDDDPMIYQRRLQKYAELTLPLLEYYRKRGVLWSVQGETSDVIWLKLEAETRRRFG